MSFKKILCPIDFSPGSQQAMRVAVRLANEADAALVLVHAWYLPPTAFAGEYPFPADVIQQLSDDAERGLETAARNATKLGAKRVTSKLLTGVPWNVIVDTANDDPAFDLVVIGTHGRTGLARVLLGSVAETVIRHAPCSVLAVRPDGEPKPFTHILCPTDFSDHSRQAHELAAELVRPGGAGITLLHVLELPVAYAGEPHPPELYRDLDKRSADLLDTWAAQLRSKVSVPVVTRSRIGRPGTETLAVLDDDRTFDLVVMGSHGRTGIKRVLLGSVAEKVVRHARCPVLVARRRG
jgi:nucleotide-binding universal stress UspA family protein